MAFSLNISRARDFLLGSPVEEDLATPLAAEAQSLDQYKAEALGMASRAAQAEQRNPTLEDYFAAAQQLGQDRDLPANEWNPRVFADLSGQNINGFLISEPKKQEAPTVGAEKNIDALNLDGDGQINVAALSQFYDNVRFDKANLHGCIVDPATSFNDEVAKAASLENVTFTNMKDGDNFTFGAGEYHNITMTDIHGGNITFEGTKVDGLDRSGAQVASITMDSQTVIRGLDATGARIVKLHAEPGAIIAGATFENTTIGMGSDVRGTQWQDVQINNSNLQGVDFSGVEMKNVTINGNPITDVAQLTELGATVDAKTTAQASPEFMMQAQLNAISKGFSKALEGISRDAPAVMPNVTTMQESIAAEQPVAPINALDQISNTLRAALNTIGNPLTPQENKNLDAIHAANAERKAEGRSLPPRA